MIIVVAALGFETEADRDHAVRLPGTSKRRLERKKQGVMLTASRLTL